MRGRWGIEVDAVPWSLWVWVALLAVATVHLFARVPSPARTVIFGIALLGAWAYFLLRGVRWLWMVTIAYLAIFIVIDLATGDGTWWGDGIGVIQLGLLLIAPTRRFFGKTA